MAKFEQSETVLEVTIGWPKFNGCVARFDKASGEVIISGANLFFRFERTVPLSDIADVQYVRMQRNAAFPRIVLRNGKGIAMPSAGKNDAREAVPVMRQFLGLSPLVIA